MQVMRMTKLCWSMPVTPMSSDQEPKLMTTTVRDYDLRCVQAALSRLHWHHHDRFPSRLHDVHSTLLHPISYGSRKLVRRVKRLMVHVFGEKAEGGLKGPWKTGGGIFVGKSTIDI
ncbi:hypothetical protein K435DRAFT_82 [Dendrothele bispora CBS 962.96]|uniref:Uncharacterized protein n=1 Tax=Dendrothele bispora (strain CBS 962.96) TaxID=1314807 RepID=A0A4S8MXH9_DENBC|nr:hypothetical protein K435DRAFT_82 [Dendrothele bispora CBS 962.96]